MDNPKNDKGQPMCGRPTSVCATCRHHLRCHKKELCQKFGGPRDPCRNADPAILCSAFQALPCTDIALMHNGCCQRHGGKNLQGIAHPSYKGKGHSSVLPKRMLADYEAHRNNPDRLSLEDEIAELRALRADIWRMLDSDQGIAVARVRQAQGIIHKALTAAHNAQKAQDAAKFAEAMSALSDGDAELAEALAPLAAMEAARGEAADLAVKVEKLLKTENSRLMDERGMVSMEAALADRHNLVRVLIESVEKHVPSKEIQTAIRRTVGTEYARLTGRRDAADAAAPGGAVILDAQYSRAQD